ncbi:unnamed protein product [Pleuronectes platessa]|uniref:Uncharacterized protein n=1 Tax=Pleuronectes platessa TaxID=8262 RepID=A0A9N7TP82_PLEPL|nr:unnamed protein product [Pleuronectes platessa]
MAIKGKISASGRNGTENNKTVCSSVSGPQRSSTPGQKDMLAGPQGGCITHARCPLPAPRSLCDLGLPRHCKLYAPHHRGLLGAPPRSLPPSQLTKQAPFIFSRSFQKYLPSFVLRLNDASDHAVGAERSRAGGDDVNSSQRLMRDQHKRRRIRGMAWVCMRERGGRAAL